MKKIEIEIPDGYEFDKNTMSVIPITEDDHSNYIDLGLPSGILWGDRNIGSTAREEWGKYYSFEDAKKYHCPTEEQIKELIDNCSWVWVTMDNADGYLIIGKNGNYIFLPVTGQYCDSGKKVHNSNEGYYWSSSQSTDFSAYAKYLGISKVKIDCYCFYKHHRKNIRTIKLNKNL